MIDHSHALPVTRQAQKLGISRGSIYYSPRPTWRSCGGSTRCTWTFRSRVAGCCAICLPPRHQGWLAARRHADEEDGERSNLPAAEHLETGAGAQELSLSAAQALGDAAQLGLGDRHNLRPDGTRLRPSYRHRRLIQPAGAQLATVDHAGDRFLHRGFGRSANTLRNAGDL